MQQLLVTAIEWDRFCPVVFKCCLLLRNRAPNNAGANKFAKEILLQYENESSWISNRVKKCKELSFPFKLSLEATISASGSLGKLCAPFQEVFMVAPESQVPVSICQIRMADTQVGTTIGHLWPTPRVRCVHAISWAQTLKKSLSDR